MDTQKSRKTAFELLYEIEVKKDIAVSATNEVVDLFAAKEEIGEGSYEYITKIVYKAADDKQEIEDFIKAHLKDWSYDRIPKTAIAAIKLAVCEIKSNDKINAKIAISEAIKILAEYEDEKSVAFVNGILAEYIKAYDK